eukprot:12786778-Ditylum_brightwellii.AAC.1
MTGFMITLKAKYEIIAGEVYCDVVDDNLKLEIKNGVGIDTNDNFNEFLAEMRGNNEAQADLLEKCTDGCEIGIAHDDMNGAKSNANVMQLFATGRPNIADPYAKYMDFEIVGETTSTKYKAAFVVTGYYSKGPGKSFALPTHKPIMVLRDPP